MSVRNKLNGALCWTGEVTTLSDGTRVAAARMDRTTARQMLRIWDEQAQRGLGDSETLILKCKLGRVEAKMSRGDVEAFVAG